MAWNYEIESINSIAFNPVDETEFVVCSSDSGNSGVFMRVWRLVRVRLFEEGKEEGFATPEAELQGHTKAINVARFEKGGTMLATGSDDCKAIVWSRK